MRTEIVDFIKSVIEKFQRLKMMTMVVVYEKNQCFGIGVCTHNLFRNFK